MNPDNFLLVACGDAVVVAAARNVSTASDVVAVVGVAIVDDVVVVLRATVAIVVWVKQCWMRPCTSL